MPQPPPEESLIDGTLSAERGAPSVMEVPTRRGLARATVHRPAGPNRGSCIALVLHGAGTDTSAPPLPFLADALAARGVTAVRLDQPYRVFGRRAPDPAHLLDAVLLDALPAIRVQGMPGAPLGLIGRSSGARVACRVAEAAGAVGVVCLGFPLRPPRGRAALPKPDRAHELRGAQVRVLVVQGDRDPFGVPARIAGVRVRRFPGVAHTPTAGMASYAANWLARVLTAASEAGGNTGQMDGV